MAGCLHQKVSHTTFSHPRGVVYEWLDNQKLLIRADKTHKFSNGTLNKIRGKLEVMMRDNRLVFGNKCMTARKWTSKERTTSILEKIEKTLKER
nr:hypothetical protein [Tanacetum cinerariifolium]